MLGLKPQARQPCCSLPRSRFLDVTQRSPKRNFFSFGGALRDIQKTAARETSHVVVVVVFFLAEFP